MATYFSKQEGDICKTKQAGALEYYLHQRSADTNLCRGFTLVHALSVDDHKHSPAERMRCCKFCTLLAELKTDAAPMFLWFVGCQNSSTFNSLHYCIDQRSWLILLMCAVSILVGLPGTAADLSVGTVFTTQTS